MSAIPRRHCPLVLIGRRIISAPDRRVGGGTSGSRPWYSVLAVDAIKTYVPLAAALIMFPITFTVGVCIGLPWLRSQRDPARISAEGVAYSRWFLSQDVSRIDFKSAVYARGGYGHSSMMLCMVSS